MKRNIVKVISDIFFYLAVAIGGYGLIRTIIGYIDIPSGVCPITTYRPTIIIAMILSILSILTTWIYDRFWS